MSMRERRGARKPSRGARAPGIGPVMNPGYVYILINPSFPDIIKIGRTVRDPRTRARELSRTGVPTPFQLAFETFSAEHRQLEAAIHAELSAFRLNDRREFFRCPLHQAIAKLQELNRQATEPGMRFVAEDITARLYARCPNCLRSDIAQCASCKSRTAFGSRLPKKKILTSISRTK